MPTPPADRGMSDLFGEPECPLAFVTCRRFSRRRKRRAWYSDSNCCHSNRSNFTAIWVTAVSTALGTKLFLQARSLNDPSIPDYLRRLTEIASQISGTRADEFEQLWCRSMRQAMGSAGTVTAQSLRTLSRCRFWHLASCGSAGKSARTGSAGSRVSATFGVLLSGTVRNSWQHSIAAMNVLRYSVTLRTFRPGHSSKDQRLVKSRTHSVVCAAGK